MKKSLAALLAAAMLLTACGDKGGNTSDAEIREFKDFFLLGQDFQTLNGMNTAAGYDLRVIGQTQSNLLSTDIYGNIVGELAESWDHNDDYTVWTFTLRDGLKWVNRQGEEMGAIKAEDCVTSCQWVLTASNGSTCTEMMASHMVGADEYLHGEITDFSQVGIKALDDKTIEYTLKIPAPWFDTVTMYSSFMPVAKEALDMYGDKYGNSPDTIWYSGAYIITDYTADQDKTFEKNAAYWDVANVEIDKVVVLGVKDTESTKELFERGELDYCTLQGTQPIKLHEEGNEYMFQTDPGSTATCIYFNNGCVDADVATLVSNENFRQAVFYGLDKLQFVENYDPINPKAIYASGYTGPRFVTTSDGTDYTNLGDLAKFGPDMHDEAKGQEYWAKAKEELDGKVTWPVEIPYYIRSGNETAANGATLLKDCFEQVFGAEYVTLKIGEYSSSVVSEVMAKNVEGIDIEGWSADYRDPMSLMGAIVPGVGFMNNRGSQGFSHWEYPEFVELYEKACATLDDLDARYTAFANAEAYLLEHAYYYPLYVSGSQYRMTRYNPYSRLHSYSGAEGTAYRKLKVYDHKLTAEEVANMKAEWEAGKAASIKG